MAMRYIWLTLAVVLWAPTSDAHERRDEILELGDLANLALECGYVQQLSEETGYEWLFENVEEQFFEGVKKYGLSSEQLELMVELFEEGRATVIERDLVRGKKITDDVLEEEGEFFIIYFTRKHFFCTEVKKDGFRW